MTQADQANPTASVQITTYSLIGTEANTAKSRLQIESNPAEETMTKPGTWDFGLSAAQEACAEQLHTESIIQRL